jgi:hypothetical protein
VPTTNVTFSEMLTGEIKMSKFGITIGLILSAILHAWLFRYGIKPAQSASPQHPETPISAVAAVEIAKLTQSEELPKPQHVPEVAVKQPEQKPIEKQTPPPPVEIPQLVESGKKQTTDQDNPGDFAGSAEGPADPVVRINWGSLTNAVSILDTSGMKLVIYESGGSVKKQVVIDGASVSIKPLQIDQTTRYSDSLRIVDKVPAFAAIKNSLKIPSADHLAVLVPVSVERIIESAKITEISKRSLSLRDVKVLGGRFNVTGGKVIFIIEKVLLRS